MAGGWKPPMRGNSHLPPTIKDYLAPSAPYSSNHEKCGKICFSVRERGHNYQVNPPLPRK